MIVPWKAPMTAQAARPTMRPAHQGQSAGEPIRASAMAAPDRADEADREVDFAEDQGVQLGHAQQDDEGRLHEEVDDVGRVRKALDCA